MRALISIPKDASVVIRDVPVPAPEPKEILIKVHAVALNHVDALYTAHPIATQDYRIVGSDFAGEVVQVGKDLVAVSDKRVQLGARVAGFVQGACSANQRPGAFAEYVAVEFDLTWNIPTLMSFEEAATISLCGLTAAQAVFSRLQLPCPFQETKGFADLGRSEREPVNVFIYGATSSIGLYAAQLVRLAEQTSDIKVRLFGAASASKHDLLQESPYKYDFLVDYRDSDWAAKIREAASTANGVQYALDTVSQGQTVGLVESTLHRQGKFAVFRSPTTGDFDMEKLKIKPLIGAVWEGLGKVIVYHGAIMPANPEARKFTTAFYNFLGLDATVLAQKSVTLC